MLELISEHACFGGVQRYYQHHSRAIGLAMRFSVYLPPQAAQGPVPALFYLAGLTCNEETFMTKAGAQRHAARAGMMLVAPDTSPRGAGVPGETDNWELGAGAGFYIDATEEPWRRHYRMYSYVLELHALVLSNFPAIAGRVGIMGHSMGGHGALALALRNPQLFHSVSALAPIAGQPLLLRRHEGYDHGYYFIATVIEDHIRFHHESLGVPARLPHQLFLKEQYHEH